MSELYPTALDDSSSLPNPGATDKTNSPDHAGLHSNTNGAIKAVEAKVGIGATTPTANTILRGTGVGTTAWGPLTSAQLAAIVSDETGTGSVVFGTNPTLITPSVDTINESTSGNGVTIDGLNIKDGKLNTNNSIVASNFTPASVGTSTLAPSAATPDKWTNPYVFDAYRTGAWTPATNVFGLVTFDTLTPESSSDYSTSTGKYTAPVTGFYSFSSTVTSTLVNNGAVIGIGLYKNGSLFKRGNFIDQVYGVSGTRGPTVTGTWPVFLTAGDYVQVYYCGNAGIGSTGQSLTCFSGYLVTKT